MTGRLLHQQRHARQRLPARLALGLLCVLSLAALAAPWLAPYDPIRQLDPVGLKNTPPGALFLLGTDPFSRDLLSRALFGARASLTIGAVGAAVAIVLATAWGGIAASLRDDAGDVMMGLVDAVGAIPRKIVLLTLLLIVPEPSLVMLAALLGVTSWTTTSRVLFVHARGLKAREFVTASRAIGASPWRVLTRHVAPHLAGPLVAAGAMLVADLLAIEAGLSFLGLGVRAPTASWGSMLQDGVPYLGSAWWIAATPCVLLIITVLSISHLAEHAGLAHLDDQAAVSAR